MATAGDLITASFIKVGVDSPTAAQTASALISLNNMVSLLGAQHLLYSVVAESYALVAADTEYTIGSGGQWDTDGATIVGRPIGVKSCFLRDADNNDYPVRCLSSRDYNDLSNKSYTARPNRLYFLPEYPLAKIIFNTSPDYAYDAYFEFYKNFVEFALTTTTVALPAEYKEFLVCNLGVSLGEDWGRKIPATLIARAIESKDILATLIASQQLPPLVKFDFGRMGGRPEADFNIVTDDLIDGGAF